MPDSFGDRLPRLGGLLLLGMGPPPACLFPGPLSRPWEDALPRLSTADEASVQPLSGSGPLWPGAPSVMWAFLSNANELPLAS